MIALGVFSVADFGKVLRLHVNRRARELFRSNNPVAKRYIGKKYSSVHMRCRLGHNIENINLIEYKLKIIHNAKSCTVLMDGVFVTHVGTCT